MDTKYKFYKDSIYVRNENAYDIYRSDNNPCKFIHGINKGDIVKCLRNHNSFCYYAESCSSSNFRLATIGESKAYYKGIKNINDKKTTIPALITYY